MWPERDGSFQESVPAGLFMRALQRAYLTGQQQRHNLLMLGLDGLVQQGAAESHSTGLQSGARVSAGRQQVCEVLTELLQRAIQPCFAVSTIIFLVPATQARQRTDMTLHVWVWGKDSKYERCGHGTQ